MYVFKNIKTSEVRISTAGCASNYLEAWIWSDINYSEEWNYGICDIFQSENCIDISSDHVVTFYNKDLERCLSEGKLILLPTEKIENNQIVLKSNLELLEEGIITQLEYDSRMEAIQLAEKKAYFRGKKYKISVKYTVYEENRSNFNVFFERVLFHYGVDWEAIGVNGEAMDYIYFDEFKNDTQKEEILQLVSAGLITLENFDATILT